MHRSLAALAAAGISLAAGPIAAAQTLDTTSPVLTATNSPSAQAQLNFNPSNGFPLTSTSTGTNNWYTSAPVTFTLSASDNVGVTKLQYSLDAGANWIDLPVTGGNLPAFTAEGTTNNVRARAFDAAGNPARGTKVVTTLNQTAAAGAAGLRLTSTSGRAVGDELVVDPGANQEVVHIASIPSPAPASPNPNVTITPALTKPHYVSAPVEAYAQFLSIPVQIDTQRPTVTFPADQVVNNRVGHSVSVLPTRVDPTPGSGAVGVRETWLDGAWVYPDPLDASKLSLGRHTWEILLADAAGNGNKVKLTFLVTTSFADLDALLTRYQTAGTVASATVTSLRAKLTAAKAANDAGDKAGAISGLEAFGAQARADVTNAQIRDLLITDSLDVIRQVRGIADAPAPTDLGITSTAAAGPDRHLFEPPAAPSHNANAAFKVLIISPRADGFRHQSIEDTEVMIQKLGAEKGFDVDIWDAQYPAASLPDTPFTSAVNLAQYKVIIGDSSVGNNTFNSAYTMKNGSVVDEQAAFRGYVENGGGYIGIHGADDSMHNWSWYQDLLGGLFVSHPGNQNGFGMDCACEWAELNTEDPTHPATDASGKPRSLAIVDELYHFDRKPRLTQHVLMTLNEDTYRNGIGVTASTSNMENGDHPITWCSNFDGGRTFIQVLGHNWQLAHNVAWFKASIYQGILTAGGMKYANCVTHTEVKTLIAKLQSSGGLTASAAGSATALVQSAFDKYYPLAQAGISASLSDLDALRTLAQDPASGDAASRAQLLVKAQELKSWMQTLLGATNASGGATGSVPATLSLSLGQPAAFGAFTPGVAKTYTAVATANVISTAGDATLSVADPSSTATGKLVNGSFSLTNALQVAATSALGAGQALANVGGSSAPTQALTYSGPVSNDAVTLKFSQSIGANEPLRTGAYSKTLTFTLSTTTP